MLDMRKVQLLETGCYAAPPVSLWRLQQLSGRPGSSSSFNGQDGAELLKQRRRLDMEVLSQRTRAVAAERALAEAVQENKALQQHVRALEVRVDVHRVLCPSSSQQHLAADSLDGH